MVPVMMAISGDLIAHVRFILSNALNNAISGNVARYGINAGARFAFSAYITAVASVEAFLNEELLGPVARMLFRDSSLWGIKCDKLEIQTKLIIVPQMLFGTTFDISAQPAQDFRLLVKVRNDLVHYKMQGSPPKYIADLSQRRIALTNDQVSTMGVDYLWPQKLSSTEGIRWAHNTVCKVVHKLVEFIPEEYRGVLGVSAPNYQEIPRERIREWFDKQGGATDITDITDRPI